MMANSMDKNIVWHAGKLTSALREDYLKQKGAVIWLTGLPSSGKSTIAHELEYALVQAGKNAYVLDGDNVRHGLSLNLGFSQEDRKENIRRIGEVSKLFSLANVIVIVACVSPYRGSRDFVRSLIPKGQFFEIYCDTPLEICEQRDPKGFYRQARAGRIPDFTGISAPYEAPLNPELILKTGSLDLKQCVHQVLALLRETRII